MYSEDRTLNSTARDYLNKIEGIGLRNRFQEDLTGLLLPPASPRDRYIFHISLLISPLRHLLEAALLIDEGPAFRLIAARNSRTLCDRRFDSEKAAKYAFTAMFANFPHSLVPQEWTSFIQPGIRWLEENFPYIHFQSHPMPNIKSKAMSTKKENGFTLNPDDEYKHTQNRMALDLAILSDSHLVLPFNKLDSVRVAMLCNPFSYFTGFAYIVEEHNRYRLIVTRRSYMIMDSLHSTLKEAYCVFNESFVKNLPNKHIPAEWSDFFYPPENWLHKRLRSLK